MFFKWQDFLLLTSDNRIGDLFELSISHLFLISHLQVKSLSVDVNILHSLNFLYWLCSLSFLFCRILIRISTLTSLWLTSITIIIDLLTDWTRRIKVVRPGRNTLWIVTMCPWKMIHCNLGVLLLDRSLVSRLLFTTWW